MGWRDDPIAGEKPAGPPSPQASPASFSETPGGAVTGIIRPRPRSAIAAQEPGFAEAWRGDPEVGATAGQKVGAIGQGATGGFVQTAPIVAGAVMGGKAGAPFLPPFGAAAGAVVGGITGLIGGQQARDALSSVPLGEGTVTRPVSEMPSDLRPYGAAGEVIGSSAPFAALPVAAGGARIPEFDGAKAGPFVNKILETAERSPGAFLGAEAAGVTGAAIGGGAAEAYAPGETGIRIGAEIVGGLFNPTRVIVGSLQSASDAAKSAIASMSRTGREGNAAKILQEIVTEIGEDPTQLAKVLRESPLPGTTPTSAQHSGSPALAALEAKLGSESAKFSAESKRMADNSLAQIRKMIVAMEGSGNPVALQKAAELRETYFKTLLSGRVEAAEKQAMDTAARITSDTPAARSALARNSQEALDGALAEARRVENELWFQVPRDAPAKSSNVVKAHDALRSSMLPEEALPDVVTGFVNRTKEAGTTSGELLRLRSRMLALARQADAQNTPDQARIYGLVAEAALDDLTALGGLNGLNEARAFSFALNDTFTRTFAGQALATGKGGAERIPPELMMRRAFAAGKEAGALRFKELEEAMSFLPKQGLGGEDAATNLQFMLDTQQRILRLSASESIDPLTGRVSPTRLARFLSNNEEVLDRFPDVRRSLQDALKSEQGLRDVQRMTDGASKAISNQAAFARVGKFDSPVDAVRSALNSKTPGRDFTALARLAKRGGTESVEGFKASVIEDALDSAATQNGDLSFNSLKTLLLDPVRPGLPSRVQMLRTTGTMSPREADSLERLVREGLKIEKALTSGVGLEQLVKNPDGFFDLFTRIAGARMGSAISAAGPMGAVGGGSGPTLIAASRGSSFMQDVLKKVPAGKTREILIEAAREPKLAAALLTKPKSQTEGIRLARQIHSYLLQAGIVSEEREQQQ